MTATRELGVAEMTHRLAILPLEVESWHEHAFAIDKGFGIHASQIEAVRLLFQERQAKQQSLLSALQNTTNEVEFVVARERLERDLCGVHGLMSVFRLMLEQRNNPHFRGALDAADLIAADCYQHFIRQAQSWGVLEQHEYREPPLTYLNSLFSPAAFTRNHVFAAFKMPLDGYSELRLPISVISLPFHHTPVIWTFCSLFHEVGHTVDNDLKITDAFAPILESALDTLNAPNRDFWRRWRREMVADACGVILGGEAFVRAMMHLLLLPERDVGELSPGDSHPTPFVRVPLLCAMLEVSGWPDASAKAQQLQTEWRAHYPSLEAQPQIALFLSQLDLGKRLLQTPFGVLANRTLVEFNHDSPANDYRVQELSRFLTTGLRRPNPSNGYAFRFVPAAAQLAFAQLSADFSASSANIHTRAREFIEAMPRPQMLAVDKTHHADFLRQLAQEFEFFTSTLDETQ